MAEIWLRGEFLLNAQLPLCPPRRIIDFNISKMIAYAKSKTNSGYPNMTYDCWKYLAQSKLQLSQQLTDLYFDVAWERCKAVPSIVESMPRDQQKVVPLMCFAVFLFVQQANRVNLRASMIGVERRPRTYSETDTSVTRVRRSSFGISSLGQDMIESKVKDFVLGDLQQLLDFMVAFDERVPDHHSVNIKANSVTLRSLVALDLIFEGWKTPGGGMILPLSAIVKNAFGTAGRPVDLRKLEDFIRKNLRSDPFSVATPFWDGSISSSNDGAQSGLTSGSLLKRTNSEASMIGLSSSESGQSKSGDVTGLVAAGKAGKVRHNGKAAPESHRMVIANFFNRKTVGKAGAVMDNTVLHVGKCVQSHIYLLSPFKSVLVRRCRGTTIILGPTASTVRLQNCQDCTLVFICRRLFITDCQRCVIYVKTPTNPVIFGTTNEELALAPYCTWYGELEKHMASVNMKTRPDHWNEPLVFANENPKPSGMDKAATSCYRLMDPKDFYPMNIPFKIDGDTKTIPGGIPMAYKRAVEDRQKVCKDWNKFVNGLKDGERRDVKAMVEPEFRAWLEKTGHMEELKQLKQVEAQERKRKAK